MFLEADSPSLSCHILIFSIPLSISETRPTTLLCNESLSLQATFSWKMTAFHKLKRLVIMLPSLVALVMVSTSKAAKVLEPVMISALLPHAKHYQFTHQKIAPAIEIAIDKVSQALDGKIKYTGSVVKSKLKYFIINYIFNKLFTVFNPQISKFAFLWLPVRHYMTQIEYPLITGLSFLWCLPIAFSRKTFV